jgi:hypothetical protein
MSRISLLLIFLSSFLWAGPQADESSQILEKIDYFRVPYNDFLIRTRITSYEKETVKETAVFDAYISGPEKSLVIAKDYKTKDMKLLYVEENMWVYLPNTHRPIRITPIQRLMGEASNGDVARVNLSGDYDVMQLGTVDIEGVLCLKLQLTARKKSATYHRIILYVREQDFRSLKAEFFLLSGKHFKTAYYEEYKPVAGRMTLSKMTIFDAIQKEKKTVFEYILIEDKTLPTKYFNKNYLIHIKDL